MARFARDMYTALRSLMTRDYSLAVMDSPVPANDYKMFIHPPLRSRQTTEATSNHKSLRAVPVTYRNPGEHNDKGRSALDWKKYVLLIKVLTFVDTVCLLYRSQRLPSAPTSLPMCPTNAIPQLPIPKMRS